MRLGVGVGGVWAGADVGVVVVVAVVGRAIGGGVGRCHKADAGLGRWVWGGGWARARSLPRKMLKSGGHIVSSKGKMVGMRRPHHQ